MRGLANTPHPAPHTHTMYATEPTSHLFTIHPVSRSQSTPRCRLHYRLNVSFNAVKYHAHLALHCWSWRAVMARSGHAEHRQSRAAGYVAGAAPTVPGRLVAERDGGRMRALEQTGREVGRGNASLAKGLAPRLATKQGHDRRLDFESPFFQ